MDASPPPSGQSEQAVSKEFMRRLPLFSGLDEDDLERLYQMASVTSVGPGALLIREGEAGDALYIVIEGELEIVKGLGAREQVLATRGSGEVVGEMALLEQSPRSASARALRGTRLLVIDQAAFRTLLACSSSAAMTILRTIVMRLRNTEALVMQQEKLAALGTMAAGLAHELNNPAAAVQRATAQLGEALGAWERAAARLGELGGEEARAASTLRAELAERARQPPRLGPLERSQLEDELQAWLEARDLERAWELAPPLVAAGWTSAELGRALGPLGAARAGAVLEWLAAGANLFGLLHEAHASAGAISALVKAVKSYAYLDQAPVQEVDVHESLETTLVILRHKMKEISLRREYAAALPRIEAYGSELNQVWTNILDNAVDATGGRGEITIRTFAQGAQVVVELQDDGPGIPEALQGRIFEPFFTTKPPGSGSGLGLHIAYTIVTQRHRGQLRLRSEPGFTCFRVALPLRLGG